MDEVPFTVLTDGRPKILYDILTVEGVIPSATFEVDMVVTLPS